MDGEISMRATSRLGLWFGAALVANSALACASSEPKASARTGAGPAAAVSGGAGQAGGSDDAFSNPNAPVIARDAGPSVSFDDDASAVVCGRQSFSVAPSPADILLVLDRSGSMKDDVKGDTPPSGAPSKWDLVVPALQEVITATGDQVNWGLKLFPLGDKAGECKQASYPSTIAVQVKDHNAQPVNDAISGTTPDGDGTPTSDAVAEGVKYLQSLGDKNPKYLLLATDGEPSCAGTDKSSDKARSAAFDAVTSAAAAGFHTFVVGIATTKDSATKVLTMLAQAGGEAPASGYYLASTKDELVKALQAITGQAAACSFPLSSPPPDPAHVGVMIGSDRVARDTSEKNGWNFSAADDSALTLFGDACERVKSSGANDVNVVFGCKEDPLF